MVHATHCAHTPCQQLLRPPDTCSPPPPQTQPDVQKRKRGHPRWQMLEAGAAAEPRARTGWGVAPVAAAAGLARWRRFDVRHRHAAARLEPLLLHHPLESHVVAVLDGVVLRSDVHTTTRDTKAWRMHAVGCSDGLCGDHTPCRITKTGVRPGEGRRPQLALVLWGALPLKTLWHRDTAGPQAASGCGAGPHRAARHAGGGHGAGDVAPRRAVLDDLLHDELHLRGGVVARTWVIAPCEMPVGCARRPHACEAGRAYLLLAEGRPVDARGKLVEPPAQRKEESGCVCGCAAGEP